MEIGLRDGIAARTVDVDAGTLVDTDVHGTILVIEVRPARRLPLEEILHTFDVEQDDAEILRAL